MIKKIILSLLTCGMLLSAAACGERRSGTIEDGLPSDVAEVMEDAISVQDLQDAQDMIDKYTK